MGIETKTHTFQAAAVATGNGTPLTTSKYVICGIQVEGITSATVIFEATIDGTTWYAIEAINQTDGTKATTTTADGLFRVDISDIEQLRCRISAWASGTIIIKGKASDDAGGAMITDMTVSGEGITISQTPTVTAAGAYTANDVVGGLLTFAGAARVAGYGGIIKDMIILDDAGQDAALELWLFNATFTAIADNGPWAPSEADLRKLVAIIDTGSGAWFAAGTPSAARVEANQRYDLVGTSLFGQLVTRGTPTFVATDDVTVIIGLIQD